MHPWIKLRGAAHSIAETKLPDREAIQGRGDVETAQPTRPGPLVEGIDVDLNSNPPLSAQQAFNARLVWEDQRIFPYCPNIAWVGATFKVIKDNYSMNILYARRALVKVTIHRPYVRLMMPAICADPPF